MESMEPVIFHIITCGPLNWAILIRRTAIIATHKQLLHLLDYMEQSICRISTYINAIINVMKT